MGRNYQAGDPPVFLRWLGGKRWIASKVVLSIRSLGYVGYREPFLGSGSVFFALRPESAVLSDINMDLINVYRQIQIGHKRVTELLNNMPVNKTFYNRVRRMLSLGSDVERAAKFLYLNRTCFSGIYRVNKNGEFNVPFGGRDLGLFLKSDILAASSRMLSGIEVTHCDFEASIRGADAGDIVYCDPPYVGFENSEKFTRYNEKLFSWNDQVRLASSVACAIHRGAKVIMSNSNCTYVENLYRNCTKLTLPRSSRLSANAEYRSDIKEALYFFPRLSSVQLKAVKGIWGTS
jgi:DNA adenine methylase